MRALVIGATGGIGRAVTARYRSQGVEVVALSRRETGFDLRDADSVEQGMRAVEGTFDRLVVATGQLAGAGRAPEKSLREVTAEALADQFAVNAIGPALVLRHLPRLLARKGDAKVAVLSARVGSIGDNRMGGWYAYRAAKAALNQLVHTAAIELARSHPNACLIAYHPGTVATEFTRDFKREKQTPQGAAEHLCAVLEARASTDSGLFFDWSGREVAW
ncbi:C-factor [Aquimixticola soesokkakensis]|uniref:C-factor n=1 Tax=Aquimixticola soesokkakensis TaxID=1519096 RepID=A0A1Y5S650_9RHOB|nr:SDR family NAD(P)-dependent oxidoreductase [Aquimixticola soesokkakensis]SLN33431.1 C-factor [Aquimixticola soesokkakensis]